MTFKAPGRVAITVTHDTTGAVARIELVAVEPQISGASVYLAESTDGERYTFKLHAGTSGSLTELPEGYDVGLDAYRRCRIGSDAYAAYFEPVECTAYAWVE